MFGKLRIAETHTVIADFTPQPDITAYELAQLVANLGPGWMPPKKGVHFTAEDWETLGPLKRHFSLKRL